MYQLLIKNGCLLIAILCIGVACIEPTNQQAEASTTTATKAKKNIDDNVVSRLSADLVINPTTQPEKEKNALINHAIDNGLDVQETPSGIFYQIIEPGTGVAPVAGDIIHAHYKGTLLDGREFDSSYKRGEPLKFGLHQMIPAWQEILPKIKPGGKAVILTPSAQAYGARSVGRLITPNSPLKFELEIISIDPIDE